MAKRAAVAQNEICVVCDRAIGCHGGRVKEFISVLQWLKEPNVETFYVLVSRF